MRVWLCRLYFYSTQIMYFFLQTNVAKWKCSFLSNLQKPCPVWGFVVLFCFLWGSIFWESVCTQVCVGTREWTSHCSFLTSSWEPQILNVLLWIPIRRFLHQPPQYMFTSDCIAKEPNRALVSLELTTILKTSEITQAEDSGTIKEWLICFSVASMSNSDPQIYSSQPGNKFSFRLNRYLN